MTVATGLVRRSWLVALAALALFGGGLILSGASSSAAQTPQYNIVLSPNEEVPAVTGVNVAGRFMANVRGQSVEADLSASGETFTMAHFHQGKAGANGPVVAFLYGPNEDGADSIHPTPVIKVDNLVGPLKGDWAGFVKAWNAGEIYVNVHSKEHPAGVLRGQIPARPAAPGAPNTGTGSAGDSTFFNTTAIGTLLIGLAGGAALLTLSRRRR